VDAVVAAHCRDSAEQIVQALFDAVATHSEGVAHFDDETVVVVKVRG